MNIVKSVTHARVFSTHQRIVIILVNKGSELGICRKKYLERSGYERAS